MPSDKLKVIAACRFFYINQVMREKLSETCLQITDTFAKNIK